jgi:hypothetical protein
MADSQLDTGFAKGLNRAVRLNVATPKELSRVDGVGCSPEHIRAVAAGRSHMALEKAEVVSTYLCEKYEYAEQIDGMHGLNASTCFLHPDEGFENDDDLSPELMQISRCVSRTQEALQEENRDEAEHWLEKAHGALDAAHTDARTPPTD